ncbi:hypothetical protein PLICRDRAFT_43037 [Plicaturopsis crispa FD-325 SS-3]|nr:hypothetical protein PLICRDRAFT_43037 [Plicaturopsis crispa FD-325 SS-3]
MAPAPHISLSSLRLGVYGSGATTFRRPECIIQDVCKRLSVAHWQHVIVKSRRAPFAIDWAQAFGNREWLQIGIPNVFLPALECLELRGIRFDFPTNCAIAHRVAQSMVSPSANSSSDRAYVAGNSWNGLGRLHSPCVGRLCHTL